ncbi:MAG TPA: flavin reductase family protein [Actinophytocola sp.]|uniref:flavin reductase family protein n=1 Tax=Actinophytocola sp. TaxID=1872138 RepID=UPI002DDD05A3|nr:flavin reductase family protein [Actinophytocola sp.]HEV2781944.1 flavin reductase family protein [Actinophytocola sp.]
MISTVYPASVSDAMAQWPTGIAVVTTADQDGWWWGCTADSFSAVSVRPPLVSVCLAREHRCRPAFTAADAFAVHVLRTGQEDVARRFGCRDAGDFDGLAVERGLDDVPLLGDVAVRMECRTSNVVPAGDHVMLIAEVVRVRTGHADPLVYLRRTFRQLSRRDHLAVA